MPHAQFNWYRLDELTGLQIHAVFSPVVVGDASPHWYGLGPVAVLPK